MRAYYKYWVFILTPILIVAWLAYLGQGFIARAIGHNPALNYAILAVMLVAVVVTVAKQVGLWREAQLLQKFIRAGNPSGASPSILRSLDVDKPGIAAILGMIAKLGGPLDSDIDQRALNQELTNLTDNYGARLSLPHFFGGFMVALGLFGTFVGLLETLNATSDLLSHFTVVGGDAGKAIGGLISSMQGPLAGMGTAFSASLFGLLGSLVIGAMTSAIEGMSHRILDKLRRFIDEYVVTVGNRGAAVSPAAHGPSPEFLSGLLQQVLEKQMSFAEIVEKSLLAELDSRQFLREMAQRTAVAGVLLEKLTQMVGAVEASVNTQSDNLVSVLTLEATQMEIVRTSANHAADVAHAVSRFEENAVHLRDFVGTVQQSHARMAQAVECLPDLLQGEIRALTLLQSDHSRTLERIETRLLESIRNLLEKNGADVALTAGAVAQQTARLEKTNVYLEQMLAHLTATLTLREGARAPAQSISPKMDEGRYDVGPEILAELQTIVR